MAGGGGGATLTARGLVKRFQGVVALDGVDLELAPGAVIGLLGPNGSGKTTLVNCLSGVLPPTEGEILSDGRPIGRLPGERRARLGLVRTYQNLRLFRALSVAENVRGGLVGLRLGLSRRQAEARLLAALADQGLEAVAHQPVGTLPYGLQKRTEIARALIARPRILLLDEPAAGLGGADWESLAASLRRAQAAIGFGLLLIDHNVAFVRRLAATLMVLASGRVIRSGPAESVLADAEVARIYLGGLGGPGGLPGGMADAAH